MEAAGHTTQSEESKSVCMPVLSSLLPLSYSPGSPAQGRGLPAVKMSLPTPVNTGKSLTDVLRSPSVNQNLDPVDS